MTLVAVTQMTSNDEVEKNLDRVHANVLEASARGAELIVVPECFAFMGKESDYYGISESLTPEGEDGPILARCRRMAEEAEAEIVFGGFWERSPTQKKVRNASVHMAPDGSIAAVYRKIHLFDVDLADGTKLCESAMVEGGEELVTTQSAAGVLGMTICYDVRFPEVYRALGTMGAELLSVPAAFTLMTGKDHWEVLLRARAIEAQCFVLAAAQVGKHVFADGSGNRQSWGHAMIIDPWGTVLAQCAAGQNVAVADVDLGELERIRRQLPALQHRKLE